MAVPSAITDLSVTATSNSPAGTDVPNINTGPDDYIRAIASIIRREQAQFTAVASAATVDLGAIATGNYGHITGTVTITSFGTVAAGIERTVVFDGVLTLTHNATSLILRTGANRTTAAGDVAVFVSEGSGNWREKAYHKVETAYQPLDATLTSVAALDATAGLVEQTGADTFTKTTITAFAKTVLDDADAATARATLGTNDAANITTGNINANRLTDALNAPGTAPLYVCRAWVNFNGTGTVASRASGDVSSITDNGVGLYTINFITAMPDVNYAVFGMSMLNRIVQYPSSTFGTGVQAVGAVAIRVSDLSGTAQDEQCVNVAIFR